MRYSIMFPLLGLASAVYVPAMEARDAPNGTIEEIVRNSDKMTPGYNPSDPRMEERGDITKCQIPCTVSCIFGIIACGLCWGICGAIQLEDEKKWKINIVEQCTQKNENCDLIGKDWFNLGRRDLSGLSARDTAITKLPLDGVKDQFEAFVNAVEHGDFGKQVVSKKRNEENPKDKKVDSVNWITKEEINVLVEQALKRAAEYA